MSDLDYLSEKIKEHIEDILSGLGLDEYENIGGKITMPCPIHGGDNPTAVSLFVGPRAYVPNWKCYTNQCETEYGKSIFGFFRGVLEIQKDTELTNKDAIKWLSKFLQCDIKITREDCEALDKKVFTKSNDILVKQRTAVVGEVSREWVRFSLAIPSHYFLERGFSEEILHKYDVGYCNNVKKEMAFRAVVPIYDDDHKYMVGCTGRSTLPKCHDCGYYHRSNYDCPEGSRKGWFVKWKTSSGFRSENYLYNYWYAKEHIIKSNTAILVEGQGDVWRLEEAGIHNSVGIFGTSLSDGQKILLEKSGTMNIILLLDNDAAGRKAEEKVISQIGHMYNIYTLENRPIGDIGDMSVANVKELLLPKIRNFKDSEWRLI